ncbi:MAG: TldD/PmbA family protein [Chloroflexi bacterium]|nr:TldD/PmbA family protein [Chloroflexota bacterium]
MMIGPHTAQRVLEAALANGADLAELYLEDRASLNLSLEDSRVEGAVRGADRGAGVRAFYGNTAAYAYTDDLELESLLRAARAAAAAANRGHRQQPVLDLTRSPSTLDFPVEKPFEVWPEREKSALLHRIDAAARGYDPRIVQVSATYSEYSHRVWVFNSEGRWAEDERNIVEVSINVTARANSILQQARAGFGGQMGLELFERRDAQAEAREVAESAVKMLNARPAPAGEMTVVMRNGWGGVLFHEACGHALEADFINRGTSIFAGRLGQVVASPLITLLDDATVPARRGSYRFDDDGTPAQQTVLVERGRLTEYMWDLAEARRAGRRSTGNGRRESYRYLPIPRMTNTFIAAGESDPQEIMRSVDKGLYVARLGGGQANVAKGDFVFSVTEGYLLEEGVITAPVRGATLIGNGLKVLAEIDMVGSDLELDRGQGRCGKGQWVPVSVGQPTLRVPRLTVGGTAT